ncbi:8539_t:CDS:2 [Paraglomus occultum]|uniref:8539_t:CDS:1 n=1 Tax=Paraglomus occultum TaxID=144539 RepID=A0A9N9BZE4_9GLOM|nr:8539_t:CDS:2 [Paraglomus occultum]
MSFGNIPSIELRVPPEDYPQKEKIRMIISVRKWRSPGEITGFRHLVNPGRVVDVNGQTLLHLGLVDNFDAVEKATDAPQFRPQKCVDKLLCDFHPLSNSINRFLKKYYGNLYEKLSKLEWGAFAPRPFGVFPMIAINYNTISDYHWDENDESNSFCCLVALGDFEGGELCFPQLKIVVPLRPRQIILFSSRLLLHGNFIVTKGIRHGIVYFVHSLFFHHQRDFSNIYSDLKDGVERDTKGRVVPTIPRQDLNDARDLNNRITLSPTEKSQIEIPERSCDKRRGNIDLSRARRGLKAEDDV